jgi:uncharacterized protein
LVLERAECLRLLALAAADGSGVGRVGFSLQGVPVVLPVNYGLVGGDVVVRTGEGLKLLASMDRSVVAFEVDEVDRSAREAWSVLVRGMCEEITGADELEGARRASPPPLVPEPGEHYLRIRTGIVTGRRFTLSVGDRSPSS